MTGVVPRNATASRAASPWAVAVICLGSSRVLRVHPARGEYSLAPLLRCSFLSEPSTFGRGLVQGALVGGVLPSRKVEGRWGEEYSPPFKSWKEQSHMTVVLCVPT